MAGQTTARSDAQTQQKQQAGVGIGLIIAGTVLAVAAYYVPALAPYSAYLIQAGVGIAVAGVGTTIGAATADIPEAIDKIDRQLKVSIDSEFPHETVYGRVVKSGSVVWAGLAGSQDEIAGYDLIVADHACSAVLAVQVFEDYLPVTTNPAADEGLILNANRAPESGQFPSDWYVPVVASKWNRVDATKISESTPIPHIGVKWYLGDQTADDPHMVATFTGTDTENSSDYRPAGYLQRKFKNKTVLHIILRGNPELGTLNQIIVPTMVHLEGKSDIWDTRLSGGAGAAAYTNTAALVLADYMATRSGIDDVVNADVEQASDDCEDTTWDGNYAATSRTNLVRWSRNLTAAGWSGPLIAEAPGGGTESFDQTGIDGDPNTATLIDDTHTGEAAYWKDTGVDVGAGGVGVAHTTSLIVKKESSNPNIIQLTLRGAMDATEIRVQMATGSGNRVVVLGSPISVTVGSYGSNWWRLMVRHLPTAATGGEIRIAPAITSTLGGATDGTVTGSIIVGHVQCEKGAATNPIVTTGSPATVAAIENDPHQAFVYNGVIRDDEDPAEVRDLILEHMGGGTGAAGWAMRGEELRIWAPGIKSSVATFTADDITSMFQSEPASSDGWYNTVTPHRTVISIVDEDDDRHLYGRMDPASKVTIDAYVTEDAGEIAIDRKFPGFSTSRQAEHSSFVGIQMARLDQGVTVDVKLRPSSLSLRVEPGDVVTLTNPEQMSVPAEFIIVGKEIDPLTFEVRLLARRWSNDVLSHDPITENVVGTLPSNRGPDLPAITGLTAIAQYETQLSPLGEVWSFVQLTWDDYPRISVTAGGSVRLVWKADADSWGTAQESTTVSGSQSAALLPKPFPNGTFQFRAQPIGADGGRGPWTTPDVELAINPATFGRPPSDPTLGIDIHSNGLFDRSQLGPLLPNLPGDWLDGSSGNGGTATIVDTAEPTFARGRTNHVLRLDTGPTDTNFASVNWETRPVVTPGQFLDCQVTARPIFISPGAWADQDHYVNVFINFYDQNGNVVEDEADGGPIRELGERRIGRIGASAFGTDRTDPGGYGAAITIRQVIQAPSAGAYKVRFARVFVQAINSGVEGRWEIAEVRVRPTDTFQGAQGRAVKVTGTTWNVTRGFNWNYGADPEPARFLIGQRNYDYTFFLQAEALFDAQAASGSTDFKSRVLLIANRDAGTQSPIGGSFPATQQIDIVDTDFDDVNDDDEMTWATLPAGDLFRRPINLSVKLPRIEAPIVRQSQTGQLLSDPFDFTSGNWTPDGLVSRGADVDDGPDITPTADELVADTGGGQHGVSQTVTGLTDTLTYSVHAWFKAGVTNPAVAARLTITSGANSPKVTVTLADRVVISGNSSGTYAVHRGRGGWTRLDVTVIASGTSATVDLQICDDTGTNTFTAASERLRVWGAYMVQSAQAGVTPPQSDFWVIRPQAVTTDAAAFVELQNVDLRLVQTGRETG